jgi:diguanylate cyclase (GGDEF)-like protein
VDVCVKLGKKEEARSVLEQLKKKMDEKQLGGGYIKIDVIRCEAMVRASEGDLAGAKSIFEKAVQPQSMDAGEVQYDMLTSLSRVMLEYAVFLYDHKDDPEIREPVSRILDILTVVKQINEEKGNFFVFLKGATDLIEKINRESNYEVVMQQRQDALLKLTESLSAINEIHDMGELLPRITDLALDTLKGERGILFTAEDGELFPEVIRGFQHKEIDNESVFFKGAQLVYAKRKPVLSTSRELYDALKMQLDKVFQELKSVLIVPIQSTRDIYGVMYLDCGYFKNIYNEDSVDLLTAFANQAAIAIENVRLFEAATRDGMTGLYGHRAFREIAQQEFRISKRYNQQFSVVVLDIDDFKDVNDTYGHAAGDQVIKGCADFLRKSLRDSDVLSRYGGDEFEIILPRMSKKNSKKILEKIRRKITTSTINIENNEVRISVSIGVACFPADSSDLEELFKKADKNMYKAKRDGKNKIYAE